MAIMLLQLLTLSCLISLSQSLNSLYVLYLTTSSIERDFSGSINALEQALNEVNRNEEVMPGYQLALAAVKSSKVVGYNNS